MYILHINFYEISFSRTQDLHFPENYGKIMATQGSYTRKLYEYHLAKLVHSMQNFVRFHAIESELELPIEFWKKRYSSIPYCAICNKIVS